MQPKDWGKKSLILLAIFLPLALIGYLSKNIVIQAVSAVACLVWVAVNAIGDLRYWRCPSCKKSLPGSATTNINVCPYCGAQVNRNPANPAT